MNSRKFANPPHPRNEVNPRDKPTKHQTFVSLFDNTITVYFLIDRGLHGIGKFELSFPRFAFIQTRSVRGVSSSFGFNCSPFLYTKTGSRIPRAIPCGLNNPISRFFLRFNVFELPYL